MLTFHRPQGMAWKRWAKSHLVKAEPIVFFPMCKGDQHQCYKDSCPNGGACDHVESMYPPPEFSLRGFFLSRSRPFRPYGMGDLLYISSSLRYRGFISFCYMSRARFRLYIYIFFWAGGGGGGGFVSSASRLLCMCVCCRSLFWTHTPGLSLFTPPLFFLPPLSPRFPPSLPPPSRARALSSRSSVSPVPTHLPSRSPSFSFSFLLRRYGIYTNHSLDDLTVYDDDVVVHTSNQDCFPYPLDLGLTLPIGGGESGMCVVVVCVWWWYVCSGGGGSGGGGVRGVSTGYS